MDVDHLFVDESHKFKNLTFTTRHDRVAGLGNTEGSQKALEYAVCCPHLTGKFDSDLCVTFLSGTPISNSLTEMYLIFKYLRPNEMERQHVENFDGWAAVFAKKTTDFEFSVTNEIIAKERFRHFIKVPELALFYNEITDYKTAKHINIG
jgi:N12 class adenine-specific DNA methylase